MSQYSLPFWLYFPKIEKLNNSNDWITNLFVNQMVSLWVFCFLFLASNKIEGGPN